MTSQENALVLLARVLDAAGMPYMIIGGMANAIWGVPRATLDVDATVWTDGDPADAIGVFDGPFRVRPAEPRAFVAQTRVLPLETPAGVRVDVVFGLLPFEQEAIGRAISRRVAGHVVRFCTAEDLLLLKLVSTRQRDRDDVRGLLEVRASSLDRTYLDPRVRELAEVLERPQILEDYLRGIEAAGR